MSISALIPLAGSAAGAVATAAGMALDKGMAFLDQLTSQEQALDATGEASEADKTGPEKLNPLEKQFAARLKKFEDEFRMRLKAMGIQGDVPMQLSEQSWGGIGVEEDHPDKEAIESLFANDPLLASQYHALAQQYRQMQGMESDLSEYTRRDQFTLTITAGEMLPGLQPR
jgi:hypothetical protein